MLLPHAQLSRAKFTGLAWMMMTTKTKQIFYVWITSPAEHPCFNHLRAINEDFYHTKNPDIHWSIYDASSNTDSSSKEPLDVECLGVHIMLSCIYEQCFPYLTHICLQPALKYTLRFAMMHVTPLCLNRPATSITTEHFLNQPLETLAGLFLNLQHG